jgi:hypothetical protein
MKTEAARRTLALPCDCIREILAFPGSAGSNDRQTYGVGNCLVAADRSLLGAITIHACWRMSPAPSPSHFFATYCILANRLCAAAYYDQTRC